MLFYKSKELSERLGINLSKWKRWIREFLPPDPLGGLQSGYARQLNLRETFKVYLGGYLVSDLKFSLPQARTILFDLSPWLRDHGFYNLHLDQLAKAADKSLNSLIFISHPLENGFAYTIHDIKGYEQVDGEGGHLERFVETVVNAKNGLILDKTVCGVRAVSITNLTHRFVEQMDF